jgi:hypothetical protein
VNHKYHNHKTLHVGVCYTRHHISDEAFAESINIFERISNKNMYKAMYKDGSNNQVRVWLTVWYMCRTQYNPLRQQDRRQPYQPQSSCLLDAALTVVIRRVVVMEVREVAVQTSMQERV